MININFYLYQCIKLCQQFSDEEVENMECPWENPLFENTDQLMDERYIPT